MSLRTSAFAIYSGSGLNQDIDKRTSFRFAFILRIPS